MRLRTKITVEECPTLDVRSLADAGYFEPSRKRGMVRLRRGDREIGSLAVARREGGLHLQYDVFSTEGARTRLSYVVAVVRTPATLPQARGQALPAARKEYLPLSYLPQPYLRQPTEARQHLAEGQVGDAEVRGGFAESAAGT